MNATLLDQFLAEECTPYVRDLVRSGLEAGSSGAGPRRKRFELNRFEVTFDLDEGEVLIEDVLDAELVLPGELELTEQQLAVARNRGRIPDLCHDAPDGGDVLLSDKQIRVQPRPL
jgi:hypothetical protein